MNWDPDRKQPRLVRCTERRYHIDRCRWRAEDCYEWLDMPGMEIYRCDYEFVPEPDGTYTGLREGRDD